MSKFRKEIVSINVFYEDHDNLGVFCINGYYQSAFRHVFIYKTYISKESFFKVIRNLFNTRNTLELQISVDVMPVGGKHIKEAYNIFEKEFIETQRNRKDVLQYIIEEFRDNGIDIMFRDDDFCADIKLLNQGEKLLQDI